MTKAALTLARPNLASVRITSQTSLVHVRAHPGCGGELETRAQLYLESSFSGCEAWGSGQIATASNANHRVTAQRDCAVYLCSTAWHTRGRSYFNDAELATVRGNAVRAGELCQLGSPPPPPPPPPPGTCEPFPQSPLPDIPPVGCGPISPLVIDLAGDGLHFSSLESGVLFDILAAGGKPYWVAWPVDADDAWLALDRSDDGVINDAGELFGTATTLRSGALADNGFEALAEWDANGDGVVDEMDKVYERLLVWNDANRNGRSEPRELRKLWDAGVASISLAYRESKATDQWGNGLFLRSDVVLTAKGAPTRAIIDVYPLVEPAR